MSLPRPIRTLLGIGALTASALILAGCSLLPATAPERDANGEITEAQDNADVFAIVVGDCLNETTGDVVESVPVVPCAEEHDEEAYYAYDLPDGEFPGDAAITASSEENCGPQFDVFAGIAYDSSTLDWYPYVPTASSWDGGDREILCIIYDPAGPVVGSLAGAAR